MRLLSFSRLVCLMSFVLFCANSEQVHARIILCKAETKGGSGWIPSEIKFDVSADAKQVEVIRPVSERFGAKTFKRGLFGQSFWSTGKGVVTGNGVDRGQTYRYDLQLEFQDDYSHAKVKMIMQGYRDNILSFDCMNSTDIAKNVRDEAYALERIEDNQICTYAISRRSGRAEWDSRKNVAVYVLEAKRRGLNCGIFELSAEKKLTVAPQFDTGQFDNRSVLRIVEYSLDGSDGIGIIGYTANELDEKRDSRVSPILIAGELCQVVSSDYRKDWSLFCPSGKTGSGKFMGVDASGSVSGVGQMSGMSFSFTHSRCSARIDCETIKKTLLSNLQSIPITQIHRVEVATDTQAPVISITSINANRARGNISGVATDNTGIAEVLIDGQAVPLDPTGRFTYSTFVPSGGVEVQITAYDLKGLSSTETIRLEREVTTRVAELSFDALDPTTRQVESNTNAIALIVGVGEYSKTAPAEFADKDAQVFYDYAHLKLGIPQNRIQTLVNDKADVVGLLTGVNKWLKRSVKQGESDVYIFFAGHGLASDDGDTAYLIPYDGAPDFLERTAISRDEIFREVSSVNPRSVTVFLDTCYSGDTRGESRLIAGRPLGIKLQEQSLPAGFTVLTAAGGDQIAKPLKEAQHGMFSYFLMKGMEGDADSDGNNEITARELHSFVRENVVQQSGGSQVPELQGDGEKVLVRFR